MQLHTLIARIKPQDCDQAMQSRLLTFPERDCDQRSHQASGLYTRSSTKLMTAGGSLLTHSQVT